MGPEEAAEVVELGIHGAAGEEVRIVGVEAQQRQGDHEGEKAHHDPEQQSAHSLHGTSG